jgi:LysM repeat protein
MADNSLDIPTDGITGAADAAAGTTIETPLPPKPVYVRVNPGDSIDTIAERYGTTADAIMQANNYAINPDYLLTGMWIWV